jgi:hypothetical protein
VHGVYKAQAFLHTAFAQRLIDVRRDVDECTTPRDVELQIFSTALHKDATDSLR